ncbi:hypothetical protein B0T21DRAFT_410807 [Apiosordaria backusii]|uniref:Uncharacterized protein n=1 Tax=Apiosordaria backusii TaxID=314023 RepID=A0AA40BNC5_9PEZI|nr:hypothetical protein B0T21DRAFT_410807 [Apiosordaria backusii]
MSSVASRRRRANRRGQTSRSAGSSAARPPAQERLGALLPKAGMVYANKHLLLDRTSVDNKVARAIKHSWASTLEVSVVKLSLTKSIVDKALASIFAAATELTREIIESGEIEQNADTMVFLNKLKLRVGTVPVALAGGGTSMGVGSWARLLPSELFFKIFMILRAARRCWFDAPREPFAVEEHCALARNIDRFFEVDMVNWGDFAMVQWVTRGGLGDLGVGGGAEQDDEVVDIFVGAEEEDEEEENGDAMEVETSAPPQKLLTREEVEETLARVRVDIDREALEVALTRLHL